MEFLGFLIEKWSGLLFKAIWGCNVCSSLLHSFSCLESWRCKRLWNFIMLSQSRVSRRPFFMMCCNSFYPVGFLLISTPFFRICEYVIKYWKAPDSFFWLQNSCILDSWTPENSATPVLRTLFKSAHCLHNSPSHAFFRKMVKPLIMKFNGEVGTVISWNELHCSRLSLREDRKAA